MVFGLLLKNSGDVIDKTHASNLEEAINFFRNRKQMDEKTFNGRSRIIDLFGGRS